jgi:hypothetical protein
MMEDHAERKTMTRTGRPSSSSARTGAGNEQVFFRVDAPHQPVAVSGKKSVAAIRVAPPAQSAATLAPDAMQRLDTWVRREGRRPLSRRPLRPVPRAETAFEGLIAGLLRQSDWRHGIAQFRDALQSLPGHASRILLISLTDELDGARLALATARLLAESSGSVLLADGDCRRRSLSLLLQADKEPAPAEISDGDWMTMFRPLHTAGVWFLPATSPQVGPWNEAPSSARTSQEFAWTITNAGPWPVPELAQRAVRADAIFSLVGCGTTRSRSYRELLGQLQRLGRKVDGCIAVQ